MASIHLLPSPGYPLFVPYRGAWMWHDTALLNPAFFFFFFLNLILAGNGHAFTHFCCYGFRSGSCLMHMLDTVFVKVEDLRILPWLSLLKWMLMSKMFIERLRLKVSGCALKGLLEPELNRKWGISVMVIINLFKNCFDTCLFTDIWLAKYVLICKHADDYWFQRVKLKMCTSGLTFFCCC